MKIRDITPSDIPSVLPIYIDYYNRVEGSSWTEETAGRRIEQVLTMKDSYGLMAERDNEVIGFIMAYFKQYDDIIVYSLEEILIKYEHQRKGLGSSFLDELERRVREKGASSIELDAVNDDMHEKFYRKAGYKGTDSLVLKVKWFE